MRLGVLVVCVGGVASLASASDPGVHDRHPIYVGVRACAKCHAGKAAGHQVGLWRASAHSGAYACLWSPQSKKIAELSGIPEEPQESAMCLGCHATGSRVEAWEKEDEFLLEDGVQCETCHGPGSEYANNEVMMDREKAMMAGLRMPRPRDCMMCHNVKGSHVAVLSAPQLDVAMGMKKIAHPTPNDGAAATARPENKPASGTRGYVGVMKCAGCHKGPMMGYQFSKWRDSGHAAAYAVLGTPAGYQAAEKAGARGVPQELQECLVCHATGVRKGAAPALPGFDLLDGVQCEACHGPGSDYAVEAVMRDPPAARQAGLLPVTAQTCAPCHGSDDGSSFDYTAKMKKISHPLRAETLKEGTQAQRYKTPLNLALSPDGTELYVACEASDSVVVVDVASRRAVAEITTGGQPTGVAFSPDGTRAFVTNRLDDTMVVVDTQSRTVLKTVEVGDEPHGVLMDQAGRVVYVLNTSADSISVIDGDTGTEKKRLTGSRGPWAAALSPDGERIACTNTLSRFVEFREPSLSEVTIINTRREAVEQRITVPGANLMQGIAWHPSGEFALITLNRTKNLVPMTRLLQGWTITNGMGVIWRDGRVNQVLLDEPHLCFPDAAGVAISPDGKLAFVTSSGSDRVAVIDVDKLITMLRGASQYELEHVLPNHLGKPTEFILKHIETRNSPRGVLFSSDGRLAFVANALDDSVTVIDVPRLEPAGRIDLGGPQTISKVRWGELLFHSADVTFHRQFSCHSCHPDGHIDGLTYDIEPDGIGSSPVDNRTLRGILDTAPFKWEGTNPSLQRQCGPRLAVFFTRIDPFTPEELAALDNYICTIPRPPNRYRPVGGKLTPAQRRGKAVFERTVGNDGKVIPEENRCATCHFAPLFTDRTVRDVGTKMMMDREAEFDVPHLNNIYDSAPYLHNGTAETLEEIWTRFNPYDEHGVTNDMTKDQLNDLMEYLKTL